MTQTPESPRTQRLFFALWPDDDTREQLHRLARHQIHKSGRPVPRRNLHITLAFIGSVTAEVRDCLLEAAARVQGDAFELDLDRVGFWPGPRIQWLAPSSTPQALTTLVADLSQALSACGWEPERRAYLPHITVARKVMSKRPVAAVNPISWSVRDFVLVESVTDERGPLYRVLARWPLV